MRLDELVKDINISVEDYFLNFYDIPENILFKDSVKVFENSLKTKKLFILESNTFNDFEDVKMTIEDSEKNRSVFEELKNKSFYFLVKTKEEFKEKYIVSEEVFTSLDEAISYAKEFFKG